MSAAPYLKGFSVEWSYSTTWRPGANVVETTVRWRGHLVGVFGGLRSALQDLPPARTLEEAKAEFELAMLRTLA